MGYSWCGCSPERKDVAKLERWTVVLVASSPFQAPEQQEVCLVGEVFGHMYCYEGESIRTTNVRNKLYRDGKEFVVTKSGTEYELGEPEAAYERQFPGSKQRLFDSLKEKE